MKSNAFQLLLIFRHQRRTLDLPALREIGRFGARTGPGNASGSWEFITLQFEHTVGHSRNIESENTRRRDL